MRARVHISDVVVIATVSVATLALAPVYYDFIQRLSPSADPLSQMLLQLILPIMFIGLIVSIGVSARRRV